MTQDPGRQGIRQAEKQNVVTCVCTSHVDAKNQQTTQKRVAHLSNQKQLFPVQARDGYEKQDSEELTDPLPSAGFRGQMFIYT